MPQSTNDSHGSDNSSYQQPRNGESNVMSDPERQLVVVDEQPILTTEPTFAEIVDVYIWSALDSDNTRRSYRGTCPHSRRPRVASRFRS